MDILEQWEIARAIKQEKSMVNDQEDLNCSLITGTFTCFLPLFLRNVRFAKVIYSSITICTLLMKLSSSETHVEKNKTV